jgi:signal transduction histidine kinase
MTYLKLFISLLFFIFGLQIHAQNASELLQQAKTKQLTDLDSSNWYITQAFKSAMETNDDSLAYKAQFLLGMNLQMQGNLQQAVEVYQQIVTNASLDDHEEIYIQSVGRIGDCLTDMGAFDSSLVYLLRFDHLVDQYWSPTKIDAKLLLGELYRAMGRLKESDVFKIEAINRSKKSNNRMEQILALYYYLDDHKQDMETPLFQEYFEAYLNLVLDPKRERALDFSHVTILLNEFPESTQVKMLFRAITQSESSGHLNSACMFRAALIELLMDQQALKDALAIAKQGKLTARKMQDLRYVADFDMYLYQIYEGLKQYDLAIANLSDYYTLRDSLQTESVQENIDALNIQYETAKKEQLITAQELALQKSRYQRNLFLGGLLMVLWFGGFLSAYFWNRNRVTKRLSFQTSEIQAQKIRQLEQEKSLLAMSSMIEGQEAERKRIAQDLHDGLGGLLSNIKAQLHVIERRVDALSEIDVYGKASEMVDKASKEVRRIAYNMMPVTLSRLGLKAAIEDLTVNLTQHHPLILETQLMGLEERLKESREVMLYRIVQELCNNVVKHAQATTLMIQTNRIGNDLVIVVEDNGKGFDMKSKDPSPGIGMKSLESRVEYLKGNLDISSSEEGTCVTIQVPVS